MVNKEGSTSKDESTGTRVPILGFSNEVKNIREIPEEKRGSYGV